jgi:hypothetical protein
MNVRTFSESDKRRIIQTIHQKPGQTGREIAQSLGFEKKRVNKFLYNEGKRIWGVTDRDWRWYPSAALAQPPPVTICGALLLLPIPEAILAIHGMPLKQVNICFEEDEFSLLDESLQAELSIRKETLESMPATGAQHEKSGSGRWFWLAVVVIAVWIASLLGGRHSSDDRQPQHGGNSEDVLPNR